MGGIHGHNYEAYLLDFLEGNLSDELQMELELFLIQHPELNIDLRELSIISIEKEHIPFSEKNDLKKSESDLVSDLQFIAYIEGQLLLEERLEVEKSCSTNPLLAKELALYKRTIAVADSSIIYANKSELKRRPKIVWFNFSAAHYSIAACIVFLIGLFMLWPKNDSVYRSELADNASIQKQMTPKNNLTSKTPKETTEPENNKKTTTTRIAQTLQALRPNASLAKNTLNQTKNNLILKDTIKQDMPAAAPISEPKKTESLIALINSSDNKHSTSIVQVITENEEEYTVANSEKKKKGIWAKASKALKNLNIVGVKSVNGNEDTNKDKTSYALTLGGLSITHKSGNL